MITSPSLRPACYNDETGHIAVRLTDDDQSLILEVAKARYAENRGGANADGAYRTGLKERLDVEGLYGELALSLLGGVAPSKAELVRPYREWASLSAAGTLTDFKNAEIRTAVTWPHDDRGPLGLFIHKDSRRDEKKDPNTICILAIVKNLAPFDNDKYTYDPIVVYPGWCYLHEVREDHFFTKCVHPEYRVPQSDLHPMGELAGKLFLMPKTVAELKHERELRAADEILAAWEQSYDESVSG